MQPKISVVIPSYNKAGFIGQTLESIVSQGYPNFEVIIQDGGSTDGTLEIIKKFAKKYPQQVIWESKRDNGQLDAIKKGLAKASGGVFTYINADDVYEVNAFNLVAKAYQENPGSLWFAGRGKVINSKGIEITKAVTLYKNFLLLLNSRFNLLVTNYLMQPSVFFTKDAYKKYGPLTGTDRFVMEYDFWLRLSKVSMPVVIDEYLSHFRISGNSISSTSFGDTLKQDYLIAKKYTKNPMILFLHNLNNWGRIFVIRLLKI